MSKNCFIFIVGLLCSTANLSAVYDFGSFELGAGYRIDRLRWNIVPERHPQVETENRWEDLRSVQVSAAARYTNCYNFLFRGLADIGEIYHGTEKRIISIEDRDLIHARSKANTGEVFDLSGGIGYTFHFLCDRSTISPIVGYSYHQQHVRMNQLLLTRNDFDDRCPRDKHFRSIYHARWKGPFVGFELTFWMLCNIQLYGGAEYTWAHYRGTGRRHFRIEIVDQIKQHAEGRGEVFNLGIRYEITPNFMLSVLGNYQAWRTWSGHERGRLFTRREDARLHVAHWHTWCVSGTAGWFY